jgi:hypothetical protein
MDWAPNVLKPDWTELRMDWTQNGLNLEWTEPRMDWTSNGPNPEWTEPRMYWNPIGLNPEWTELRMDWTQNGLNSEWTELRMDSTPTGLNPEWTELRIGLEFLSTSNGVQCQVVHKVYQKNGSKKRSGLSLSRGWAPVGVESRSGLSPVGVDNPDWDWTRNGTQPQIPLNLEWCTICKGVYQKNGFKKRIHQSISVKEGYKGLNIRVQLHVEEVGSQLLQLLLSVYCILFCFLLFLASGPRFPFYVESHFKFSPFCVESHSVLSPFGVESHWVLSLF